ncbi:MAG: chorismate synthase [Alphaproteobacteria bacterium]
MAGNSFGHSLVFTSFGESHGPSIGAILDGIPANISLDESDIQPFLDQRRPGQSKYTTQRQEADRVKILSGVFEGKTTGTPIGLLIENTDQRSKDYSDIAQKFRPGHADYSYHMKYGMRDYRGGGRSSARETAMRVAAGAIARKFLSHHLGEKTIIRAGLIQMGQYKIDRSRMDWNSVDQNPFFCPDPIAAGEFALELDRARKDGNSFGAVIEVEATGIPAGLGAPLYSKLDADLASAMMSINAVKGVEIGDGFAAAAYNGIENADEIYPAADGSRDLSKVQFSSNHAGGILGGISSGQPIIVRFAVKPTSSILSSRNTITTEGEAATIITKGRHDPCVGIRAVPIGEAMMALVLADHLLQQRAYE